MEQINYEVMVFSRVLQETPLERCGILLGHRTEEVWEVLKLAELPNLADEPEVDFLMAERDVRNMLKRSKLTGLGFWHTHPRGSYAEPSDNDMEQMEAYPNSLALVIHPSTRTLVWFNCEDILKKEKLNA